MSFKSTIMIKTLQYSHFRYARCQGGELHTGETLNLVCVDQKCDHRGLICPVCKMQSHNECYILPIKIFLAQIRDLLADSNNSDQLNNLGAYLRTLDCTKKQMLQLIKDQISELAELYKELQIKIQSTYFSLRRNVLIQSTLSTKLPSLLQELLNGDYTDSFNMQKQFSKYCQLIKYHEGKPKVTDKAVSLVEHFKGLPSKLTTIMVSSLAEYRKKLQQTCKKIETEQNISEVVKQIQQQKKGQCFSNTYKSTSIEMSPVHDEVWLKDYTDQGFVSLDVFFTKQKNSYTLDIINLGEDNVLMVGLCPATVLQTIALDTYEFDNVRDQMEAYVQADGGNNKVNQEDMFQDQQPFFFGTGCKLTVTIDWAKNMVLFKNSELDLPFEIPLKSPAKDNTLKLMVSLNIDDRVRLLPSV